MDKFARGPQRAPGNSSRQTPKLPEIRHLLWSPDHGSDDQLPGIRVVVKLSNSRKSAIFWCTSGLSWDAPGSPGKTPKSRAVQNGRTLRKYFARAVDKRCIWRYNQELQVTVSKKKGKRAFFSIIDPHQDPVVGPHPPVPLRRLKLPNSSKLRHHVALTNWSWCPSGRPGKLHGELSTTFFKSSLI